jgi:2-polyprenyl-3-methyl-5-hydroxy-6-metoxy-1,4-benzoquinol methylase
MRLSRCQRCRVVFEDPRPHEREIAAFYASVDLWTRSTDAEGRPRAYVKELEAKTPVFRELLGRIERFVPGGRLLDVGAGPGILQSVADRKRWQVTGVESSRYIADFGRTHLGSNILDGRFEEVSLPDQPFDVILMKYVLDHMDTPAAALRRAHQVLRPGGFLVIADLINIESPCARIFRAGHRLLHPMHFTYFAPLTIRLHLRRFGFQVSRIDYPFVKTPYFNARNLVTMARRTARQARNLVTGSKETVFSPPFIGSMMDVFAVRL